MLAVERRKQILEQVHKDKKVIVSELSRQFRVSEETIRRDLEKLAEDGHVIKSYGGAVINEIGSIDLPFNVRWKSNSIGKQKIADLISQEIQDGEHIFLDASTTAVFGIIGYFRMGYYLDRRYVKRRLYVISGSKGGRQH